MKKEIESLNYVIWDLNEDNIMMRDEIDLLRDSNTAIKDSSIDLVHIIWDIANMIEDDIDIDLINDFIINKLESVDIKAKVFLDTNNLEW